MPIVGEFTFSGSLNISKEIIPYVRHSIITKKPILGEVRGVYTANISTYDNNPSTQVGLWKQNVNIYDGIVDAEHFLGTTGSGAGTDPIGDELVTVTSYPLFTTDQQRSIYSQNNTSSLNWKKVSDNLYDFSISGDVMLVVPSDENIGVTNSEGDEVYVASLSEGNIVNYVYTDNRFSISYPAYQPITADIESKLILSIPSRNLWENYSKYKS